MGDEGIDRFRIDRLGVLLQQVDVDDVQFAVDAPADYGQRIGLGLVGDLGLGASRQTCGGQTSGH